MNFSVVMAVYKNDNLAYLIQAIDSVFDQTLKPDEFVIVIDGYVNEEVLNYINLLNHNYIYIKVIHLIENKGLANALNVGIKASKNSIIARMDSDDICYKNRFEEQIKYLQIRNVDVLGGQMSEFEKSKDEIISTRRVPLEHNDIINRMKYLNPFSHPTVIFKKNVFEKLGGYNKKVFPEDYDFFVRAYLAGFRLANINKPIVYFRLGIDEGSMFKRRRGIDFLKKEFNLYLNFYKLGFYNLFELITISIIKLPVRLLPVKPFKFVYNLITR